MPGAAIIDMPNWQFIKQLEEKYEFIQYALKNMQITSHAE